MSDRSSIEVVRLDGELDIARREELRNSLRIPAVARAMLVDLAEVTYADSTALSELLRFRKEAEAEEIPIALIVATPQLSRLIRYAGFEHAFNIFPDLEGALIHLEGAS